MRSIATTVLSFFCLIGYSQTNNTKIQNARTINIYGGKTEIGQIVINQTSYKPRIQLESANVRIDSTGNYITEFKLINPDNLPFFKVDINMSFSESVIEVNSYYTGIGMGEAFGYSPDKKEYRFVASQVSADFIMLAVRSKTKIYTKINGVSPKAN